MKTWRDFDVRAIQRIVQEHLGADREWSDARFTTFMEHATHDLSIPVPCRICGVQFPLNRLDHQCYPEDVWINGYVHSTHGSEIRRTGFQSHIERLQQKYPLAPQHHQLFRGLHFPTDAVFEAFADALDDNVYQCDTATSWTTDAQRAAQFARFMLKGGHEEALRHQEIRRMIDEQANMTGAFGVVLALTVRPDQVLCDIADARIGGFPESEVILLPGTYHVAIHDIFVRQAGTTVWPGTTDAVRLVGVL